ncbi:uncharacterized protein LOC116611752 isoform X2 [Nematostella vectensis]|uniref:uncharacterized protein LOC116611752 isoform X2 n=1 Tax=Nematostella vectensis TaxID=45351 RepID=UPI00207738CA|nr:uncharacterized protein LOC116611752 isoform X2 [Nematostella vectensis]
MVRGTQRLLFYFILLTHLLTYSHTQVLPTSSSVTCDAVRPCENGGTCDKSTGRCACRAEYTGPLCENALSTLYGIDHIKPAVLKTVIPDLPPQKAQHLTDGLMTYGCGEAEGSPYGFKYQWLRNGKILNVTAYPKLMISDDGLLRMISPESLETYEGNYQCLVANDFGATLGSAISIKFRVSPLPPDSIINPISVNVNAGLRLHCPKTSYGATYRWINGSFDRDASFDAPRVLQDGDGATLVFAYVTDEDITRVAANKLQCVLTNSGSIFLPQIILVKSGSSSSDSLDLQTTFGDKMLILKPEENVELHCFPTGRPTPNVTWFVDDKELVTFTKQYNISNYGRVLKVAFGNPVMVIKCTARNTVGSKSAITRVYSPTGSVRPTKIFVKSGESLTLTVGIADLLASPHVAWLFNGKTISPASRISLSINKSLVIKFLQVSDSGIYQSLLNGVAIYASYEVFVLGGPVPPLSVSVSNCTSRSTNITWKTRSHPDGIAPPSSFIIEQASFFQPGVFSYLTEIKNEGFEQTTIDNLDEWNQLSFRIKPKNDKGVGFPSVPSNYSDCITRPGIPTSFPSGLKAVAREQSGEMNVTWNLFPKQEWNHPDCKLLAWYKPSSSKVWGNSSVPCASTLAHLTGLGNYVLVDVKLQAISPVGAGPESAIVSGYSGQDKPNVSPTQLIITNVTERAVSLTWDNVTARVGSVDGYEIKCSPYSPKRRKRSVEKKSTLVGRFFAMVSSIKQTILDHVSPRPRRVKRAVQFIPCHKPYRTTSTSITITELISSTQYIFTVAAYNSGGAGSSVENFTTTLDAVDSSYIVTIFVLNEMFTVQYKDKNSAVYNKLKDSLETGVKTLLMKEFWYRTSEVIGFINGSVKGEVQVVAATSQTSKLQTLFTEVMKADHFSGYKVEPSKTEIKLEPEFEGPSIYPTNTYPSPNDSITINCTVSDGPRMPVLRWTKEEKAIVLDEHHKVQFARERFPAWTALHITSVSYVDRGNYSCTASKGNKAASNSSDLDVRPTLGITPESLSKREGDNVTFHCQLLGGFPKSLMFYRIVREGSRNPENVTSLTLSAPAPPENLTSHTLKYRCQLCSLSGGYGYLDVWASSPLAALTVYKAGFLDVVVNVSDSFPNPDTTVEFLCKVPFGPQRPDFLWLKDGRVIEWDVRHKMDTNTTHAISWSMLTIRNVTAGDRGNYSCVASKSGYSRSIYQLVDVRPMIGIHPLSMTKIEGSAANIECNLLAGTLNFLSESLGAALFRIVAYHPDGSPIPYLSTFLPTRPGGNRSTLTVSNVKVPSGNGSSYVVSYQCLLYSGNPPSSQVFSQSPLSRFTVVTQDYPRCPKISESFINWQSTAANSTAVQLCPPDAVGQVTRKCSSVSSIQADWGSVDYSGCTSHTFKKLLLEADAISSGYKSSFNASRLLEVLANYTSQPRQNAGIILYGGDLDITISILSKLSDYMAINATFLNSSAEQQNFMEVASNVLDPENARSVVQLQGNQKMGSSGLWGRLILTCDSFGLVVASRITPDTTQKISTRNIAVGVSNVAIDSKAYQDGLEFSAGGGFIHLPSEVFNKTSGSHVVNLVYKSLSGVMRLASAANKTANSSQGVGEGQPVSANTTIVTSVVEPEPPKQLSGRVKIVLENKKVFDPVPPQTCVFWRPGNPDKWLTRGCRLVTSESNSRVTTCECDHLTVFAALLDPYGGKISDADQKALELISTIGCAISLFAILLTIILTVAFWRSVRSPRAIVLLNICLAVAAVCILVIAEGTARNSQKGCKALAILLHYFLLAVFCWMLCEGALLYIIIVKVIGGKPEEKVKYFLLFGWGFPAIIVAISLGATQTKGYGYHGAQTACWLSVDNGLIWAFVAPALVVLMINIIVFVLVLRQTMGTRHVQNKSRDEKLRVAVKATAVILPLLGITWLFGLLAFSAETVAFKYIFAILNSLQGLMIFIFHCVLNKQIQDAVKRRYQQLSISDSSIGNTKSRSQDKIVKIDSRPLGPKTKTKNEYEMAPTDSSTTLPISNKVQSRTGASTVSNDDVCVHLSQDDFQYPDEGSNGCSTYNEIQDPTYENSKIQESDESPLDERLLKRDAGYINPLMLNDNDSTDDVYIGKEEVEEVDKPEVQQGEQDERYDDTLQLRGGPRDFTRVTRKFSSSTRSSSSIGSSDSQVTVKKALPSPIDNKTFTYDDTPTHPNDLIAGQAVRLDIGASGDVQTQKGRLDFSASNDVQTLEGRSDISTTADVPTLEGRSVSSVSSDVPTLEGRSDSSASGDVPTLEGRSDSSASSDVPTLEDRSVSSASSDVPTLEGRSVSSASDPSQDMDDISTEFDYGHPLDKLSFTTGSSGMSDRAQESDSDTDLVYRIAVSGETDSEPEGEWSRRTSTISIESNDSMGVFYEYSLIDVKENEENEGKDVVFLGSKPLEWNA